MSISHISIDDLIMAYRKAKVDAYYETGHLTLLDFANYEQDLLNNLHKLLTKINSQDLDWFGSADFVGHHMFALKKIDFKEEEKDKKDPFIYYSNAERSWNSKNIDKVDFRILGKHSVHFHVLSSLWLEKVGYELEQSVSENSYGCRLRSAYKKNNDEEKEERYLRSRYGHFKSYLPAYQTWQHNGIEEISKALKVNKKIIAVTADLKKFYHRIDSSFISSHRFLIYIGKELNEVQLDLSKMLIHAISTWSNNVYKDNDVPIEFKYNGHSGIPMGLGASKTIANLLLIFLDKQIEHEIKPLYYGRYVDDIFLVVNDGSNISNPKDFWKFLKKRIDNLKLTDIGIVKGSKTKKKIDKLNPFDDAFVENSNTKEYTPEGNELKIPYSPESLIEFGKGKEKYFFLEDVSGESFLATLKESLDENSSEWNLPPDIDNDIESFTKEVSKAGSDNLEATNGLRKSDGMSIQRLKFILYLKRLEIIIKFFPKKKWEKITVDFFNLCLEHSITPETISIYSKYYPRIVSLAIKVGNNNVVEKLFEKINDAFEKLASGDDSSIINALIKSKEYLTQLLEEALYSTVEPEKLTLADFKEYEKLTNKNYEEFRQIVQILIVADLHKKPFKEYFKYPLEKLPEYLESHNLDITDALLLNSDYLPNYNDFILFSSNIFNKSYPINKIFNKSPFAFYFFTRPFTLFDLSIIFQKWYEVEEKESFLKYCKLFNIDIIGFEKSCDEELVVAGKIKAICLETEDRSLNRTVAFTSLETKDESWIAVVQNSANEPDGDRVERIFNLIDGILRCKKKKVKIHYVLFPELSIPVELLDYISYLFLKKGISVIAGVEYKITNRPGEVLPTNIEKYVSNQLVYVLTVKGKWGLSHIIVKQEKFIPAQKEERELFNAGGAILRPDTTNKFLINHGGFWFAGLICNDFLDINNRAMFRGLIDALIIVEWNKDIDTYNALVEASANDLHTFVMQVNNRLYGDTRLRAPYKESYMRDQVRVRGGELDYFVISTLKVKELRDFQRHHRSPENPFKPVPTGFQMSKSRRNN